MFNNLKHKFLNSDCISSITFGLLPRMVSGLKSAAMVTTLSAVALGSVSAQQQQQSQLFNAVEVLVNDEPLSTFDINERLYLLIAISGGVKTRDEFLKMREQVIQTMTDEILQLQEAKKYDLVIPPAQLEEYFARRAQQLGLTPQKYEEALRSIRSSKQSVLKQMESDIAWREIVSGLLGQSVSVSDDEVEATIERIKANKGKYEYRLSEIVLLVNDPSQEESVKTYAQQIVDQLRSSPDVRFPDVARNVSVSSTAAVGGDLGWIVESDLSADITDHVQKLDIGEYSDPVKVAGSYRIYALANRRRVLSIDPLDVQLQLQQLFLTTEEKKNADRVAQFTKAHEDLKGQSLSCDKMADYAKIAGVTQRTQIGALPLKQMSPKLRKAVQSLKVNGMSDIVMLEDGDRIFFLCDKTEPQIQEPDFDQIAGQMEEQRLAMRARRHLRDLRRDAIIDER